MPQSNGHCMHCVFVVKQPLQRSFRQKSGCSKPYKGKKRYNKFWKFLTASFF